MLRFIAIYSPDHIGDWLPLIETAQTISPRVEIWAPHGLLVETLAQYEQDTLHRIVQITRKKSHLQIGIASTRMMPFLQPSPRPAPWSQQARNMNFWLLYPFTCFSSTPCFALLYLMSYSCIPPWPLSQGYSSD